MGKCNEKQGSVLQRDDPDLLKPMTLKEIAGHYGVSLYVMRKWINAIGIKRDGYFYTKKELEKIREELG